MGDLILKINDEAVDLEISTVVAITKQAANIGDISSVLADGTNEFSLPQTPTNKRIFENADVFQAFTSTPYERLRAIVIQEGVETIPNGFAVLNKSKNNFDIQVVGGNASFFNLINNLSLVDLELSEFDHFWTNDNVFANRNNTEGFIYSLFEQSNSEQETPLPTLSTYGAFLYAVRTQLLLPSMYVKTIVDKIFEAQGFTFVCDVTGTDIWLKQTLFNADGWNRGTDASYLDVTIKNSVDYDLNNSSAFFRLFDSGADIVTQVLDFWQLPLPNPLPGLYLIPDNCHVSVTLNLTIDNISGIADTATMDFYRTTDVGSVLAQQNILTLPTGVSNHSITVDMDCIKITDADVPLCGFGLYLYGNNDLIVKDSSNFTATFTFISSLPVYVEADYFGSKIPYNYIRGISMVPDVLQSDLLKEFAKEFNLIFDTDNVNKIVTATRMDRVGENIGNAIDMSAKLHFPIPDGPGMPSMTFNLSEYAQRNILKWAPDDVTEYDGEGFINVNDATLEGEKTIVEMKFAASSTVTRFDTVESPYVPIFSNNQPNNGLTNRLMMVKRVSFLYNINFNRDGVDLPTDDVSFSYFSEPGNEDSLDFPTLIDRYFNTLQLMLTKTKVLDCVMNLNISDVKNYSPFIPIYLSPFNAYFYWQKIENYIPGKLTKCKLIKIQ